MTKSKILVPTYHTYLQQYDLGTIEETAVYPLWEKETREQHEKGQAQEEGQERRFFPAVMHHFTGGTRCASRSTASGAEDGVGVPEAGDGGAAVKGADNSRVSRGRREEWQVVSHK